jgi:hypothetical protein
MTDSTASIRKDMIETSQPQADLAGAWRDASTDEMKRWPTLAMMQAHFTDARLTTRDGINYIYQVKETWTIAELQRDFDVTGFAAPFVVVRRKSDGKVGTLEFTHSPRVYFGFREDK